MAAMTSTFSIVPLPLASYPGDQGSAPQLTTPTLSPMPPSHAWNAASAGTHSPVPINDRVDEGGQAR